MGPTQPSVDLGIGWDSVCMIKEMGAPLIGATMGLRTSRCATAAVIAQPYHLVWLHIIMTGLLDPPVYSLPTASGSCLYYRAVQLLLVHIHTHIEVRRASCAYVVGVSSTYIRMYETESRLIDPTLRYIIRHLGMLVDLFADRIGWKLLTLTVFP